MCFSHKMRNVSQTIYLIITFNKCSTNVKMSILVKYRHIHVNNSVTVHAHNVGVNKVLIEAIHHFLQTKVNKCVIDQSNK